MKISFLQQSIQETKIYGTENRVNVTSQAAGTSKSAGATFTAGQTGMNFSLGNTTEKGKSLIELQEEASFADADNLQDYMTLMSNTMSEEDYAKLEEDGFDFGSMDPEDAVTIVDKIKAEVAKSGKRIVGYNDDLDVEALTEALGSQALAQSLVQSFAQSDLPLTQENVSAVKGAWEMASNLEELDDGTKSYLIDNRLDAEAWNLYLAQSSGASKGNGNQAKFYAEDVKGYFAENAAVTTSETLTTEMQKVLEQSGREDSAENEARATWLLENHLPLTAENLDRLENLENITIPVIEENFAEGVVEAVLAGKSPLQARLDGKGESETIYEKASRLADYYLSDAAWEAAVGDVTARRQLEEVRLHMTAEVNVKLLKSGFSIETAPMEDLIAALKAAEKEIAENYFPESADPVADYQTFAKASTVSKELPTLPVSTLGSLLEEGNTVSLADFHESGKVLQSQYEKAGESYEALKTEVRRDLGDSMKKAFANVDEILESMHQETTDENRRAVRILGYNQMEITESNLSLVKEADEKVLSVTEKLTPASVLKMIRDGINPLEKSFDELEDYFQSLPEEYREASENYSRFLYGLEKNGEISEEERESYIGIYRLVRQMEKSDGAALGAVVNVQAELNFSNLLSAVRSAKAKALDVRVTDETGVLEELVKNGESISDQIEKAYLAQTKRMLAEASNVNDSMEEYQRAQLAEWRTAVAQAEEETLALMQRGEISASAENLLAAEGLLLGKENLFGKADEDLEGTNLWEQLEEEETFRDSYREQVGTAIEKTERATFAEADSSLDVRQMQLAHKQLTVMATLADKEEYFVPMYVGEGLARVHLTIARNDGDGSSVSVDVTYGEEKLSARFEATEVHLRGIFTAESVQGVMKLEKIADIFKEGIGEAWADTDISVVRVLGKGKTTNKTFAATKEETREHVESRRLYQVAKIFLEAVGKE